VDVRIGVTHSPREIEVELADGADPGSLKAEVETAVGRGSGMFWLTDRRGREIGVSVERFAWIEIGSPSDKGRIGFGS
jgi:hypothetical protein